MEKFSFLSFCPMAVTHPSTNQSQLCLTSVISQELVCQRGYGVAPYSEATKMIKSLANSFPLTAPPPPPPPLFTSPPPTFTPPPVTSPPLSPLTPPSLSPLTLLTSPLLTPLTAAPPRPPLPPPPSLSPLANSTIWLATEFVKLSRGYSTVILLCLKVM